VFAASGGVGRSIVAQARERGHDVLALARNPSRVPAGVPDHGRRSGRGSPGGLAEALADRDAVLSGLGPSRRVDAGIASRGTATIVAAMAACSVRRLVVVSAAPVSDVASAGPLHAPRPEGDDVLVGFVLRPIVVRALRPVYDDLLAMEEALQRSDAAWTAVRPPRLTNGPRTGTYRFAVDHNLPRGRTISRADVAHAMLAALERPEWAGHWVAVAR